MPIELLTFLQTAPAVAASHTYTLSASKVFLFFFIMLGPLKLIGPFFMQTRALPPAQARAIAWKVFAISVAAVLVAAFLGASLLRKWQIAPTVMQLAAGLVFLLVALQMVLSQYEPPTPPADAPPEPQLMRLVFPIAVTPYGVATVIVLMAISADMQRSVSVLGLAIAVMALNLLAMLFARTVMRGFGPLVLQILGAVLGILQVALALQFIVMSLGQMGLRIVT
ncbi:MULTISPECIES: MarC family protein [unclassified Lysobacter]|uniref:MarC family protein n=1 Tax=unclassified Lysobacter TaxID=2635362 RepID=UPI001C245E0B|nr:MarC family protein [Lysobacter sp. MMG2]MBU8974801.1 MarC family protein [Lysobacter sp. MMG2]